MFIVLFTNKERYDFVKTRGNSYINVELEKNQALSTAMKDEIERQAMDALRFLPAEDRLNLHLKVVSAPTTDAPSPSYVSSSDAKIVAMETNIATLKATVDTLVQQLSNGNGANTNP